MRRPIEAVFSEAVSLMGGSEPEDSTEESGRSIPIQRARRIRRGVSYLCGMDRNGARGLRAVKWGVFFEQC